MRVDEFVGGECASAFLALVSIGFLVPAFRTGADNVSVGKERLCLLIVILLALFLYELAFIIELSEEFGCSGFVHCGSGP